MEDKVLVPETQRWKLTESLHPTHFGRDALWDLTQKDFSGKGLERTVKQVTRALDLWTHNNPRVRAYMLSHVQLFVNRKD